MERSNDRLRKFKRYPEYRDSGVEWLGEIPSHWEVKRLKHSAKIIMGQSPPSETCNEIGEGLPFLQGNAEFGREHPVPRMFCSFPPKSAPVGSHLLSVRAPVGAINTADRRYGIGRGLCSVEPEMAFLEKRFCFWCLSSAKIQLDSVATGSTYDAVSTAQVGGVSCVLPKLWEQQAIAAFLDRETARIDALIGKKERLIELLQEKRTALITHAVTKGLDPDVPMKDSRVEWLGEIPEHWDIVSLKYCTLPKGDAIKTGPFGSQLLSSDMVGGSIKVYNQRNVLDKDLLAGDNYITESKYEDLKAFTVFPGDILLTTRGTIGRCAILPAEAELGILHPCLMRIQVRETLLSRDFLSLLIQESTVLNAGLMLSSNATTIDVIYSDTIKCVGIPIPPMDEQRQIVKLSKDKTTQTEILINKAREATDCLKEYRTALISAAVTGKIDVRDQV